MGRPRKLVEQVNPPSTFYTGEGYDPITLDAWFEGDSGDVRNKPHCLISNSNVALFWWKRNVWYMFNPLKEVLRRQPALVIHSRLKRLLPETVNQVMFTPKKFLIKDSDTYYNNQSIYYLGYARTTDVAYRKAVEEDLFTRGLIL